MLRAYCFQEKKDWDKGLPLLLFAVREAIQTSLGFNPFDLAFGHTPHGPLKLLKEVWLDEDQTESILIRVSDVRFKLQKANKFARENMKKAQCNMKTWHDKKARTRSFKPGERVMVLLPLHKSPLQVRFCGPFTVLEKINDVDYIMSTPGRRKSKHLCHTKMLKPYHDRQNLDGGKSAATVVPIDHESVEEPDSDEEDQEVIKLKNSDILNNLDQKLEHLPAPKRKMVFCRNSS